MHKEKVIELIVIVAVSIGGWIYSAGQLSAKVDALNSRLDVMERQMQYLYEWHQK